MFEFSVYNHFFFNSFFSFWCLWLIRGTTERQNTVNTCFKTFFFLYSFYLDKILKYPLNSNGLKQK